MENVKSLSEAVAPTEFVESRPQFIFFLLINAGLLGGGRLVSFPNMNKIFVMLARFVACSCKHKSPI